ncbi:MAG: nuclear transport factor 2 family protein [Gemmatimonadota bacterium]|nr:MAG: nuclear transport factor 2 family protein [Gemmatimonadota bacterium]
MTPEEVAFAFVEAVNAKQIERISELMTPDHVYIEPAGGEVAGHEKMREGWVGYFAMVPDYHIEVAEAFSRENTVVLLGTAAGTLTKDGTLDPKNRWSVPAAWRVVVEGEQVAVWQLYVNLEPIVRIFERL